MVEIFSKLCQLPKRIKTAQPHPPLVKRTLHKDIHQSFRSSWGRFWSIASLIALGTFALVGLKVVGPDMRLTGNHYFDKYNLADINIIGSYGLNDDDKKAITDTLNNDDQVEYGYFTDATINKTSDSFRVFSLTNKISQPELIDGYLPKEQDDIALDDSYQGQYKLGDKVTFTDKANVNDDTLLRQTSFTITGFVRSPELLSHVNMGQSTNGTGILKGYAFATEQAFDQTTPVIARISYHDLRGLDAYGNDYDSKLQKHKNQLAKFFDSRGQKRLVQIKADGQQTIDDQQAQLTQGQHELDQTKQQIQAVGQYEANRDVLDHKQAELDQNQSKINEAKDKLAKLATPTYQVNNRREAPGGEGYIVYDTIANIVDKLANIFPIFLYFVAALVTLNTMTRFVSEERGNSGLLKALGYSNHDVIVKFVIYGAIASLTGVVIGVVAGHIIMPLIVYGAYHTGFSVPALELHFYWRDSLIAVGLALASAVLPAYLVARRELSAKPTDLMQPKPPVVGAKIMLERCRFIWKRLSFTRKVTARNIFRYKQRMAMTIFGTAGAVTLLFAGLGVQYSISDISQRQFGDLLKYDLIVAQKADISPDQQKQIDNLLKDNNVKQYADINYQDASKTIDGDRQSIKVISTNNNQISDYINLVDANNHQQLSLNDNSVIISQKLANITKTRVGDNIKFKSDDGKEYTAKVSGISEMYIGHFIFMNQAEYKRVFNQDYVSNASIAILKDDSDSNVNQMASKFMKLNSVVGVVQNTLYINQVDKIVNSLYQIMIALVIASALLAIVILYNLTNINVSERIRELSTIKVLGFYDDEVTMYIYREVIILSLAGIVVGFGTGLLLRNYIIAVVPPSDVMFNSGLSWFIFLVPFIAVALITTTLGLIVNRQLKHIDMLGALKAVD